MKITTVGVFKDIMKGASVINELVASGISDTDISSLHLNSSGKLKDDQTDEKMGSDALIGAAAGGTLGVVAGLMVANAILPGIGAVLVGGPLLISTLGLTATAGVTATVSGVITGAVAGGLVGGLVGVGVSGEDAEIYSKNVKDGNLVIITRTNVATAKNIFEKHGAMVVKEYTK